ncbi:alpha-adducin-like isoform X1 [Brachionus plicatilis]|uniref:Alpha-adducin-like isoform X1 n=1 Tax=Brachionus plicatilis TaxID=10195 RepID=A0A3M7SUX0_BRAPC|nr:alpha-adducin-like isoform X1 [Brachionus plicatilis]
MSTKVLNDTTNLPLNGTGKFIENIDPEDPDYRRELQRPADVKEDMRQMESRQRVSSILNSQAFREELESIIADQLKHGPHPASLIALQQISDLLLPNTNSRWQQVNSMGKGGSVLIPINDIRGIDTQNYAKGERLLRCKSSSLFRVIDLYGWTTGINNLISVRLSQDQEQFLVNPYGLLYHEVTASSLLKVDSSGTVIEQGSTTYSVNKSAFSLHSAIFKARPDIRCIIHVHTNVVTAVSSMKCGLLPLSQEAILCGNVSYHEYTGFFSEEDVKKLLAKDLGPINKIMFIRNFGVVACGETIEEASYNLFNVMAACEIQSRALVAGLDNLILPSLETQKKLMELNQVQCETPTLLENKKWKCGELEFEALMRCLDNAGYRTGYMYRQPVMRTIDRNAVKEVEIPPAATSHPYDPDYVKKLKEEKQKAAKGEWLNTPNVYSRTELEETGTNNPKKITKWVTENSPNKTSTPIRIESKNQFAPQGVDPKELKNHQKQIKQDRYEDKKTPGYQSKLLEKISYEDENDDENKTDAGSDTKLKQKYYKDQVDAGPESKLLTNMSVLGQEKETNVYTNGDSYANQSGTVVYGAASKGIIKRNQQNNAIVYKTYYAAANPFQQMDPVDLEKYKKEVAQRQIKDQAQRKNLLHRELLETVSNGDKANRSEIIITETNGKKKSHTIPRSKSLLDKKQDKVPDHIKANSGGSHASSPISSRDSSLDRTNDSKGNTSNPVLSANSSPKHDTNTSANANKSATMPPGSHSSDKQKAEKPKKKSKLSFLSRKKNKD